MIVPLVSHPHTGTHFLVEFLGEAMGAPRVLNHSQVFCGAAADSENVLIWGHFHPETWHYIRPLTRMYRPIVPMRDPLAVLISHEIRGVTMHLDHWLAGIEALNDAYAIALDRPVTYEGRLIALSVTAAIAGCGPPADPICQRWAREWPTSHSIGEHPLKRLYRAGDIEALEAWMPEKIAGLRKHEVRLKGWLARMGYKDFIW